jgi:hypothetical protein
VDLDEARLGPVVVLSRVAGRRIAMPGPRIVLVIVGGRADDVRPRSRGADRNRAHVTRDHAPLANDLVEGDARRHRDVQGSYVAEQRQGHEVIAVLANEAAQSLAFAAEDEGDGPSTIDLVPPFRAGGVEADHPDSSCLHGRERLHEIAAPRDPDVLEAAGGGAGHGLGQPGRVPLGKDHPVRTGRLGGPQDGPQIPGILDAIQDHDEGGIASRPEKLVEAHEGLLGHDGDEALMRDAPRHAVEGLPRLEAQGDTELAGATDRIGDPAIAQALDHEKAVEMPGAGGERLEHGIDAADEVHGVFVK